MEKAKVFAALIGALFFCVVGVWHAIQFANSISAHAIRWLTGVLAILLLAAGAMLGKRFSQLSEGR